MENIDAKMAEHGLEKIQYKVGDILINSDDDNKLVLAVSDYACLISYVNDYCRTHCWYTQHELDINGFKLYTEPTKTKLTLQEIADRFGLSVDEIELVESSDE